MFVHEATLLRAFNQNNWWLNHLTSLLPNRLQIRIIYGWIILIIPRVAILEERRRLRWPSCLQPRCTALCPWTQQLWVCSSGSRYCSAVYTTHYSNIILFTREIGVFDTDHSFVTSFTNPAFLFPLGIAFNMKTKEAFILGKLFILGCSFSYSSCV